MGWIINVSEVGKLRARQYCIRAVYEYSRDLNIQDRYTILDRHSKCKDIDEELKFFKETLDGFALIKL